MNRRIIELGDITGEILENYLELSREKIDAQIEGLNNLRRYRNYSEEHPRILVGRLALQGYEDRVLIPEACLIGNDLDIDERHLVTSYRVFWHKVDQTLYKPTVYRSLLENDPDLSGVWLGLTKYD